MFLSIDLVASRPYLHSILSPFDLIEVLVVDYVEIGALGARPVKHH
jgi:hypothetical protein